MLHNRSAESNPSYQWFRCGRVNVVSVKRAGWVMDMSNSMAELVDPEIYDPISQRPETMADFAELIKQTTARWQAPWYDLDKRIQAEGRAKVPFGHCRLLHSVPRPAHFRTSGSPPPNA